MTTAGAYGLRSVSEHGMAQAAHRPVHLIGSC